MEELRKVIAGAYKARGKTRLTRAEIGFALSLDLKWFSPEDSKEVVDAAIAAGLVKEEDGRLIPAFDYRSESIPPGFRPKTHISKKPLLEHIVILLERSGVEASAVWGMIRKKQTELCDLVTPEVAGIIIARERGADVSQELDEALKLLCT